ncbi:DUF2628 domain-containing protein [Rhizobium sp. P32RR-XVIII]|uniref:DUF2628 domain-containing protein n=1 Tax=Rhizobium sp. P32RR-XVIII TaxID=2726738 RepID=UPI0014566A1B|nr:DUF2628 domain-containing protein [Rhizobium sp. P32RR-XVIII]NLS05919.1 DUF2628 domain-containing protein [Rhizobium sp. P32RR-XVIII]
MTSSYVVLTAPGGADVAHEKTRIIRDGFTLLGFLFPWLWLLVHRLWLFAIAAFLLQAIGGCLMDRPGLWPAGFAITVGTCILTGIEGMNIWIRNLASKGWNEEALITADSLETAEDIYFSNIETPTSGKALPAPDWKRNPSSNKSGDTTSLGLFGFDGGR